MKLITITLNTETTPFFFIPNLFHLIPENKSVELDADALTDQQKLWIKNAALTKKCFLSNESLNKTELKKEEPVQAPAMKPIVLPVPSRYSKHSIEAAQNMLKLPVNALKKMLSTESDIQLLKIAKEQEALGKKRDKVLTMLIEKINSISLELSSKFSDINIDSDLSESVVNANKLIVSEATYEEEESVQINLPKNSGE